MGTEFQFGKMKKALDVVSQQCEVLDELHLKW